MALPDGGVEFECGVHSLSVGGWWGSVCLWTPLKLKTKILCVFVYFWAEVLMKTGFSKGLWTRCIVKALFLGVAKYAMVPMCFSTRLTPQQLLGAVFDGVTATSSCPFLHLDEEPASGSRIGMSLRMKPHCWGFCVVPRYLWKSRGVAWASHGKSTYRREVEFWPGCRYFPVFDVLFTHVYNRWAVEKGWVEWSLLFLCSCGKVR